MSTFWKIFLMILLNIAVSASVTYGVLYYWENIRKTEPVIQLLPEEVVPTAVPMQETAEMPAEPEMTAETNGMELPAELSEPTAEPTPVIRGAKVEIAIIRNPGILESEALRIVNNSDAVVSMEGWTLEDANGNVLTFPNIQLLRKGIFVEVYSRTGHTTAYEIYWNRNEAVWQSGETAVIRDMFGQIQATYRVP